MSWSSARRILSALVIVTTLAACGFHLRGEQDASLPSALARLRVSVVGHTQDGDALMTQLRNALEVGAHAQVVTDLSAPLLEISGEHVGRNVLSVDSLGNANGYVLKYELSYQLIGVDGGTLIEHQTVHVLRDYSFAVAEALAKEREERELRQLMQRDALRQIVQRLSRFSPTTAPATK